MIPEVPKTRIYIYHVAQGMFIKEVSYAKAIPFLINHRHAWRNIYRWLISNVITDFIWLKTFLALYAFVVHVLYFICNLVMVETYYVRISASHIYFYLALVFISSFMWSKFMHDLYIYMCVYMCHFCMYILFCNRAPWKNNLTEWSPLYKYVWKKISNEFMFHQSFDTNAASVRHTLCTCTVLQKWVYLWTLKYRKLRFRVRLNLPHVPLG